MIIAGFPIALRELHHLASGWLRLALLPRDPVAERAQFFFLYFSYAPDFDYLMISMSTLRYAVPQRLVGRVFLAEDQKAPFSPEQVAQLSRIWPDLFILPVNDFEWGSPRSTHAELQVFKEIAANLPGQRDFLVKVDSDVLFLRSQKWERLLHSTASAVGDGHYLKHQFAQGGLYMLRREIVQSVFMNTTIKQIEMVASKIRSVGEDMAISQMLRDAGQGFLLTRMMLFPDEYRLLRSLVWPVRREFLALHCHKDKQNMQSLCARFGLLGLEDSL